MEWRELAGKSVADALVSVIDKLGVSNVYGVSGANIEGFHDAIHRSEGAVKSIGARSEVGAAFMADAEARATNRIGVCCSTSGGGMMNLSVGVAEAFQEGIPVLAIVGQIPRRLEGCGGFQDSSGRGQTVNAYGLWSSITKCTRELRSSETFWDDLEAALEALTLPRKGPAALLVPRDVFEEIVPEAPVGWEPPQPLPAVPGANREDLACIELCKALANSTAPVIIAGPCLREESSRRALLGFARSHSIPVVTTLSDIAAFPNSDPLYLGAVGTAGHPSAHRYLNEEADLILAMGTQLEFMLAGPIQPAIQDKRVTVISNDPEAARRNAPGQAYIEADPGVLMDKLCRYGDIPIFDGRPDGYTLEMFVPLKALNSDPPARCKDSDRGILQSEAIEMLHRVLPQKGTLLFDAGNCAASSLHYLRPPDELVTSIALGMGGMGYAIAAGVGSQLAQGDEGRTVVLCGDGAFMMLGMEVHTAVEYGLPILFVVFNNGKHGMCVTRQELFFEGRVECAEYPRPSIGRIAQGFGSGNHVWVRSAKTRQDLHEAISSFNDRGINGPGVLEIIIDVEEFPPFAPFVGADAPTYPRSSGVLVPAPKHLPLTV